MAYPKRNLEVVPECNDENDNPTCWAMYCGYSYYEDGLPKPHWIWITKYDEKEYVIENSNGYSLTGKKHYKTLAGAKREAEGIAWRQEESGSFTD